MNKLCICSEPKEGIKEESGYTFCLKCDGCFAWPTPTGLMSEDYQCFICACWYDNKECMNQCIVKCKSGEVKKNE